MPQNNTSHEEPDINPARSLAELLVTVLAPFALAHFVSYLYRTVNAVVYPHLARDLGLTADSLGLLTGAYFLTFAAAQLPIGIALDRFGPRKVQVPLLSIAALGAWGFANAQTLSELVISRGLIGLGVAGSLMSAIKASSLWLPSSKLPLSTAALLSVGGLGALASTTPMHLLLSYTDWRGTFTLLSIATLVVSALVFAIVPEHPKKVRVKLLDMAVQLKELYSSKIFWRLSFYTLFAHATYLAVQSLWMGLWLHDVGHMSHTEVANTLLAGTVAMMIGPLCFGWITDRLDQHGIKPIFVCGLGLSLFLLCQILMASTAEANPWLMAISFSFFGSAATMNYAILAQSVPTHLTGRVSTSFNFLIFLLAFVVQWGLGLIINIWPTHEGTYPAIAYQIALGINLALQIPGMLLWLTFKPWKRELAHKPQT